MTEKTVNKEPSRSVWSSHREYTHSHSQTHTTRLSAVFSTTSNKHASNMPKISLWIRVRPYSACHTSWARFMFYWSTTLLTLETTEILVKIFWQNKPTTLFHHHVPFLEKNLQKDVEEVQWHNLWKLPKWFVNLSNFGAAKTAAQNSCWVDLRMDHFTFVETMQLPKKNIKKNRWRKNCKKSKMQKLTWGWRPSMLEGTRQSICPIWLQVLVSMANKFSFFLVLD
jgi:hypothetical protein